MTSLQEHAPAVAAEWHPQLNGALQPSTVAYGSHRRVWWLGACGHAWEARVDHRAAGRSGGCQVCLNRVRVESINDLATLHPRLAGEFDPALNGGHSLGEFTPKSTFEATWTCTARGHQWQARIKNRLRVHGSGCPHCRQLATVEPGTSLVDLFPTVAAEWDGLQMGCTYQQISQPTPGSVLAGAVPRATPGSHGL